MQRGNHLASAHAEYLAYLVRALTLPTIASPADWTRDNERLEKIIANGTDASITRVPSRCATSTSIPSVSAS